MKIIKVDSCGNCPYCRFEYSECRRNYYYCDHDDGKVIASEGTIVVKEAIVSPITMTISEEKKIKTYVLEDEKTEWNNNFIMDWCPLKDHISIKEDLQKLKEEFGDGDVEGWYMCEKIDEIIDKVGDE